MDKGLGRPEDPLYTTIQTKKANSTDRWETKAKVKMLPSTTGGRMSEPEKDAHVNLGINK